MAVSGRTSAASLKVDDPVLETFAAEIEGSDRITIVGHRTRWDVGGPLDGRCREVHAPKGIVAYIPEEMTVTVRAGTAVAGLSEALAERGQRCALPERGGTVGGAVAVGENDLLTLGKGRLRDSVLQVRYVSAEGQLVTGGGPTVKNVTGFDLPRLMTGALGTLGFLAEVILRTNPMPATSVWFVSDDADPFAAFDALLHPSAVLWNGTRTWVLLEGHRVDVLAEAQSLGAAGRFEETGEPPDPPPHRWSLTPADLRTLPEVGVAGRFVASVGVGTVFADHRQPARSLDPAVVALTGSIKEQFDPTGRLNPGRLPGR
ncbi:MAG: FAD-binding protein [Acidimicrobiia bacterium]|nr:FAD-binding protein [Acidimicrobiia bacterium]